MESVVTFHSSWKRTYCNCVMGCILSGFPDGSVVKNSTCKAGDTEDPGLILGLGRSPGEGIGNPLQYLTWRIPWTEEPFGLQSVGSQRVGHDWASEHTHIHYIARKIRLLQKHSRAVEIDGEDEETKGIFSLIWTTSVTIFFILLLRIWPL